MAAADGWLEDYELMPPGCKNVRLQEWLTTNQRREEFAEALEWVKQELLRAAAAGDFYPEMVPFDQTFIKLKALVAGAQ